MDSVEIHRCSRGQKCVANASLFVVLSSSTSSFDVVVPATDVGGESTTYFWFRICAGSLSNSSLASPHTVSSDTVEVPRLVVLLTKTCVCNWHGFALFTFFMASGSDRQSISLYPVLAAVRCHLTLVPQHARDSSSSFASITLPHLPRLGCALLLRTLSSSLQK